MKISTWNVNGIRAAAKKGFLHWLKKENNDIICLQEIKAKENQLPEEIINLPGYETFVNEAQKPGYSGTLILCKNNPKTITKKLGFRQFDNEGRIITIQYPNLLLLNLYMPHGGRDKSKLGYKLDCYKKLFAYLKGIKKKNIILSGDFNIAREEIDLARPKQNKNNIMFTPEERKQIEDLLTMGFTDSYRYLHPKGKKYTWWPYFANARTRNLGWRIDYIFTSSFLKKKIKNVKILKEVMGSDHCPVSIEVSI